MADKGLLFGHSDLFKNSKEATKKLVEDYTDPSNLANMMVGSTPVGAAKPLAEATLGRLSDVLERQAIGGKDLGPGLGRLLVKMGIRGTKSGMLDKIGKVSSVENKILEDAVSRIPGTISSGPAADRVASIARKFMTPGGQIPEAAQPLVGQAVGAAREIAKRGEQAPMEALGLKRVAGNLGYSLKTGEPLGKQAAQIAQQEGLGYGDALAEAYGGRIGGPNVVQSSNEKLHALIGAQRNLNKSGSPSNIMQVINKIPLVPYVTSTAAKVADMGAGVVGGIGSGLEKLVAPLTNQPQEQAPSEEWTPDDEKELQQLKEMARSLSSEQAR